MSDAEKAIAVKKRLALLWTEDDEIDKMPLVRRWVAQADWVRGGGPAAGVFDGLVR